MNAGCDYELLMVSNTEILNLEQERWWSSAERQDELWDYMGLTFYSSEP